MKPPDDGALGHLRDFQGSGRQPVRLELEVAASGCGLPPRKRKRRPRILSFVAELDEYVLDVLMRDLVGHDKSPSAFLVYLHIWSQTEGRGMESRRAEPPADGRIDRSFEKRRPKRDQNPDAEEIDPGDEADGNQHARIPCPQALAKE